MRLGGASNKSVSNVVRQNREIWRALHRHRLAGPMLNWAVHKALLRGRQFFTRPSRGLSERLSMPRNTRGRPGWAVIAGRVDNRRRMPFPALLALLLLGCAASWALTSSVRRYALQPASSTTPTRAARTPLPTPRGGGVAIVVSFLGSSRCSPRLGLGWTRAGRGARSARARSSPCSASSTTARRCRRAGASSAMPLAAGWVLYWLGPMPPVPLFGVVDRPRRRRDAALALLPGLVDQPLQLHGRHRRHRQPRGDHRRARRRVRLVAAQPQRRLAARGRLRRLRRRLPDLELPAGAHLHGRRRQRLPRPASSATLALWSGQHGAAPVLELVHPGRLLHGRRARRRWCAGCAAATSSTRPTAATPTSTRRASYGSHRTVSLAFVAITTFGCCRSRSLVAAPPARRPRRRRHRLCAAGGPGLPLQGRRSRRPGTLTRTDAAPPASHALAAGPLRDAPGRALAAGQGRDHDRRRRGVPAAVHVPRRSPSGSARSSTALELAPLLQIAIALLALPALGVVGLYRTVVRYIDLRVIVASSVALAAVVLSVSALAWAFDVVVLPRSALPIFWFVAFAYVVTSRFIARALLRRGMKQVGRPSSAHRHLRRRRRRRAARPGDAAEPRVLAGLLPRRPLTTCSDKIVAGLRVYSPKALADAIFRHEIEQIVARHPVGQLGAEARADRSASRAPGCR